MLFLNRWGDLSVGQPVCAWPTDGCPVGPGPRVNISILNHSVCRSPSARACSSSTSRWSASDRWKTCCPQTWRGKNSPSEGCGSGHFHISIWKGGFWWCGRGLIYNNCYVRLREKRLHPTWEDGVKISRTTQTPVFCGIVWEWGQNKGLNGTRVSQEIGWLREFAVKMRAFLWIICRGIFSRAKVASYFLLVYNNDERHTSWMISPALSPTAPFSHHGYGE